MAAAVMLLLGSTSGCIEDRDVDVVLSGDVSVEIEQGDASQEIPVVLGVPGLLADLLAEEGYSIDDVESVFIAGAAYGTAALEGDHDWVVSGQVDVQRVDGVVAGPRETLLEFTDTSVESTLERRVAAPLNAAGVAVVNDALQDYVDGGTPMLEFRVPVQDVTPQPTVLDPMAFVWKVWVELRVVINVKARVPDPF
jgi:hypothetical protein